MKRHWENWNTFSEYFASFEFFATVGHFKDFATCFCDIFMSQILIWSTTWDYLLAFATGIEWTERVTMLGGKCCSGQCNENNFKVHFENFLTVFLPNWWIFKSLISKALIWLKYKIFGKLRTVVPRWRCSATILLSLATPLWKCSGDTEVWFIFH